MVPLQAFLVLTALLAGCTGFNLQFTPNTAGIVNNLTIVANVTPGLTLGNASWSRWTYIVLQYPPNTLQLNADAKSQFFATGPLASWVPRFLEQDKVAGTITVLSQGTPLITGPAVLSFTLTNLRVPDNCQPFAPFVLTVQSDGSAGILQDFGQPSVLGGCQAAPVITTTLTTFTMPENGGPLNLSSASPVSDAKSAANITVFDSTPNPLPLKVNVSSTSGTVSLSNATAGVTNTTAGRTLILQGLQGSLNVALQRLQYTPDLYFGAADNVTIVVDDQDYRGPGRNGVAAATLLVNVTSVDSAPTLRLLLRTAYLQGSAAVPLPLSLTPNDPPIPNGTFTVWVTSTNGTVLVTLPVNATVSCPTAGTYGYAHNITGTAAAVNQTLAALMFLSDFRVTCAQAIPGMVTLTAQSSKANAPNGSLVVPVYIVSDGAVDGCGTDSVDWADFEPSTVIAGQQVSLILKGYKAWALASAGLALALSYSDLCFQRNFSTSPAMAQQTGERWLVTLPVTLVGNWTVCYWTRGIAGVSDWGLPNPIAMARRLVVLNASAVPATALMGGYTTCQNFVQSMMAANASLGTCGCRYVDNSTATGASPPLGNVSYAADYLRAIAGPVVVNMGCCAQNTPMVRLFPLNQNQSWGYCSQL